jgi:protein-S-isoprenylcysteine O-methyltransferase Ste14
MPGVFSCGGGSGQHRCAIVYSDSFGQFAAQDSLVGESKREIAAMEKVIGFLSPTLVYLIIFVLNAGLPGRWVTGYVNRPHSNEKLRYRLNGLLVLAVMVGGWAGLCSSGLLAWDALFTVRWYALAGAITFGLVFSFALVLPQAPVKKSFLADFYLGRLENPQLWGGRVDAKMWLYLVGAILLEINILSFAAHHHFLYGEAASTGIYLSTGLLTYFVIDYLTFEEIHLYTYDIFAERVGFKLGWGCTAFYPFFYTVPLWSSVELPPAALPTWQLLLYALVFFTGWSLARGANMQKYYFKRDPQRKFLWITPVALTDGKRQLLVSGFWGLSRHINYLGEILMATGIALCVGHPGTLWPWLYPLYYVALLFPRQIDDDRRCAAKYGPLWQEYLQKVPFRIIPGIY